MKDKFQGKAWFNYLFLSRLKRIISCGQFGSVGTLVTIKMSCRGGFYGGIWGSKSIKFLLLDVTGFEHHCGVMVETSNYR